MTQFSCILIGDDSLTIHCGDMLLSHGHDIRVLVTERADLKRWAKSKGIQVARPGPDLGARVDDTPCDWLFSIANLALLPRDLLMRAAKGAVNFHDGPLPDYAGLNAPVWAILNGETQHGVTWHLIGDGLDDGDIIDQRVFGIDADDTALTLNAKCFAAGIEGFESVLRQLETTGPVGRAQDISGRRLYKRAARPVAAASLDFHEPAESLVRLIRGLDHGNYWNPMTLPKIVVHDHVLLVRQAKPAPPTQDSTTSSPPGTVLTVNDEGLTVATGSSPILLQNITDNLGHPVAPDLLPAPGDILPSLSPEEADALTEALTAIAPGEPHWRQILSTAEPARLPDLPAISTGRIRSLEMAVDLPAERLIAVFYAMFDRLVETEKPFIALQDVAAPSARDVLSHWVPLTAPGTLTRFDELTAALAKELATARKFPAFPLDLVARDPQMSDLPTPDIGVLLGADGLVRGTALTLGIPVDGRPPVLTVDADRVTAEMADRYLARLTLASQAATDPGLDATDLADIPILPGTERKLLLENWNDTASPYDQSACLHQMFAEQAKCTPGAIALVYENATMTFADLETEANQAAHVLIEMGVGPGQLVGLHTSRSCQMLVGALAILKAGAAYVPMDPKFPADRLAYYIEDSAASVIVTQSALLGDLPPHQAQVLALDTDPRLAKSPDIAPADRATATDLAYVIYTSGSTGKPKGVMVEHRNVANFFAGMDSTIPHEQGDVWLAVTSLSFDISVLELFYTLARGFKVVISGDDRHALAGHAPLTPAKVPGAMDFSLFFWGNDDNITDNRYDLLLNSARFADKNGFCAVWTPERHFHAFGGSYPNPAVTGAAVAAVTSNLAVRAGSIVAPLHHPARIAEDWAVIDNMTNGKVGLGMASGWQPDDFILRPENTPPHNKAALIEAIHTLRKLWAGEPVAFPTKDGGSHEVVTQPRPISPQIPLWITTAGNPDTWIQAGETGAHVLTHLLGQSIDEVGEKITLYHDALRKAGHDPRDHTVTLMLHSFVADDRETAREIAREPMKDYLRSAAGLIKQYAWAFPAFKKPQGAAGAMDLDLGTLEPDELEGILEFAFLRYFEDSGLFGTVEDCVARVEAVRAIGVTEIACLIDYGIDTQTVLQGLRPLADVLARVNLSTTPAPAVAPDDYSIAAQIVRHNVTHLQCTPSMARMLCLNPETGAALKGVKHLMIGGEALPRSLLSDLRSLTEASIVNMYGPTETTIWSTTDPLGPKDDTVTIGRPIANTQVYVLDANHDMVPVGVAGELYIGGAGVTRGYWQRPDLTAERFLPDPFAKTGDDRRMYRTGDRVRWRDDGRLSFLGRVDHQVKVRGHRIEPGEIEARLEEMPAVTHAVVITREDVPGDVRLVAYLTVSEEVKTDGLAAHLAAQLPDYMIPSHFVTLAEMPLTPNRKVDRKALPAPQRHVYAAPAPPKAKPSTPPASLSGDVEGQISEIWARVLGLPEVGRQENFFNLGGHSLLAVQAHREMRDALQFKSLSITDIFRFPTVSGLAAHLSGNRDAEGAPDRKPAEPVEPPRSRVDVMSRRRQMRENRSQAPR